MRRWEYSKGWKFAAILLNQICAVVLVISIIVCVLYVGNGNFSLFDRDDSFEGTYYYQSEVREQIYRCIRAASRESKFEKNGSYDAKMLVDIEEYVSSQRILDAIPGRGLCYSVSDLLNWSLDGYEMTTLLKVTYDNGSISYISNSPLEQKEEVVYDEEGIVSASAVSYGADAVYEDIPESRIVQGSLRSVEEINAVAERYQPQGYDSILNYAQAEDLSTEELQELYAALESALAMIYNDFYAYKENLEIFSPSMTNMRYMVIPADLKDVSGENFEQKTYTNIKRFHTHEINDVISILQYFMSQDDYLIFNSADMSYEAVNMPISLSEISSYLKEYQPSVEGDYILAVAVDSNYQASDTLQEYRLQYESIRPLGHAAVYGAILGAILYLLTLVYLTLAAGRSPIAENREIYLGSFDRIRTEIAFLLVVLPACGVLFAAAVTMPSGGNKILEASLWGGIFTFLLNLLFLAGYLSLVRRIRSRTLLQNSLVYSVVETVSKMFQSWRATTKVVVSYLAFLAMNLILLLYGWYCSWLGLLAVLVLDFVVGILIVQQTLQRQQILDGIEKISGGDLNYQIPQERLNGDSRVLAKAVNSIGEGLSMAVEQSVKDERLKSDLITNVSHDIKTPLTSIINYVDLLKREDIRDERVKKYIGILEDKAQRLKHLTEDLVEASKISSGNVKLEFVRINFQELLNQTNGEFSEKFEKKGLRLVVNVPKEPVVVEADGRRLWRVIENLYNNVAKYAMPNTRVYVDLDVVGHMVRFSIKNISEQPLNIEADELTERFIRGDVARSTEGSGLGLSIAKNLTILQKGSFDIYLDGDLFKVTVIFPEAPARENYAVENSIPMEEPESLTESEIKELQEAQPEETDVDKE